MTTRLNYQKTASAAYQTMLTLEHYIHTCGLEPSLIHLVKLRASQLNGCARTASTCTGKTCARLVRLSSGCIRSMRGKNVPITVIVNALAWTEAVTMIVRSHVPDSLYEHARRQFSEKELTDLTVAVATINAWNRLSIAGRTVPGTYQVPGSTSRHDSESS
jgi:alkylhydroperoxidase family enzyme